MIESIENRVGDIPSWVEEKFRQELRLGQQPCVDHFASLCPDRAPEIREYLTLMLYMECAPSRAPSHRLSAPCLLGDYLIEACIGQGAMCSVYRGRKQNTSEDVALKVLHSSKPGARDRFRREGEIVTRLSHPNIVDCFSTFSADGFDVLVMRLIEGQDLSSVTTKPALSALPDDRAKTIVSWGMAVADALDYAHSQGVLHRDIKPANVMIDESNHLWVMDFGLSCNDWGDSSLSHSGDVIGTPRYMAPEQFRGFSDVRSDIYSWGVLFWELASGRVAWGGSPLDEPESDLVALPSLTTIVPQFPRPLAEVIDTCCEFVPQRRPQTCSQLIESLQIAVDV